MRIVVCVNNKWLVNVEADSPVQAEHKMLDLDGVWGACAFDRKGLKTDTFADCVEYNDFISMKELEAMSNKYKDAWSAAAQAKDCEHAAGQVVKDLMERLDEARKALREAYTEYASTYYDAIVAEKELGVRDEGGAKDAVLESDCGTD